MSTKQKLDDDYVKRYVLACREEGREAKMDRTLLNRDNYDMFQMRHDFSHKKEGQSTEILSKQRMAVTQITSFFQQALVDLGEWWKASAKDGTDGEGMLILPWEIQKLTNYMLKKANYYSHVGNAVQSALLGSIAITRPGGCLRYKPKFTVKKSGRGKDYKKTVETTDEKTWGLSLDIIRQENYFPDPTTEDRYEIYDSYIDLASLKKYADEDEYANYDKTVIAELPTQISEQGIEEYRKAREAGQNQPARNARPRVKLTHFYGDIVDDHTGEMLMENCVSVLANDQYVLVKPMKNPKWHQKSEIISAPLLEVANSKWHIALMDAATKHNRSLIEIFNLVLDSAMMSVHGIKQLHVDWMSDPKQASDGFQAGDTILVTGACPPGMKALEPVVTGEISPQALNVMNVLAQEFNAAALTSDLRSGVTPFREQKATAVIEQSNTITSVFQGIAKNVESKLIQPELEMAWMNVAQNWDLIDKEVFVSLFGPERGEVLSQLAPQDVFVATVNGIKFDVFGITLTLGKAADFKKYMTLLQTVSGSEVLIEEFAKKYDFGKMLGEILTSLDIDKHKIEIPPSAQTQNAQAGAAGAQPPQQGPPGMSQPGGAPGAAPNQMSQVPQAGAGSMSDMFNRPKFPGSPAISGQGGGQ